jgi:FkbM family methyltransferase
MITGVVKKIMLQFLADRNFSLIDNRVYQKPNEICQILEDKGVAIQNIFDVGAYKGKWTEELIHKINSKVHFYLFEPNINLLKNFSLPNCTTFGFALGSKNEYNKNFYSINGTGDSFYRDISSRYRESTIRKLNVVTLDSVVSAYNLPTPQLIKLDCQGSELEILKGAKQLLLHVKAIIVETSVIPTNIGAPRIQSVCDYLIDQDFKPVSISEIHNRGGILNQIDLVFYHKNLNYP